MSSVLISESQGRSVPARAYITDLGDSNSTLLVLAGDRDSVETRRTHAHAVRSAHVPFPSLVSSHSDPLPEISASACLVPFRLSPKSDSALSGSTSPLALYRKTRRDETPGTYLPTSPAASVCVCVCVCPLTRCVPVLRSARNAHCARSLPPSSTPLPSPSPSLYAHAYPLPHTSTLLLSVQRINAIFIFSPRPPRRGTINSADTEG